MCLKGNHTVSPTKQRRQASRLKQVLDEQSDFKAEFTNTTLVNHVRCLQLVKLYHYLKLTFYQTHRPLTTSSFVLSIFVYTVFDIKSYYFPNETMFHQYLVLMFLPSLKSFSLFCQRL